MTLSTDLRRTIWGRDNRRCGICGQAVAWAELDIDHIHPRMLGGHDGVDNLRASHRRCNQQRGAEDRRRHGIGPGRPGAYPDQRLIMRVDERMARRLAALTAKLEWSQSTVIRQAVREMAERHGVEGQPTPTPPAAPPASEEA